jgi:hypothetical protein
MHILIEKDHPLEHIKQRFPEYFNSNPQHISLYHHYWGAKKKINIKYKSQVVEKGLVQFPFFWIPHPPQHI